MLAEAKTISIRCGRYMLASVPVLLICEDVVDIASKTQVEPRAKEGRNRKECTYEPEVITESGSMRAA